VPEAVERKVALLEGEERLQRGHDRRRYAARTGVVTTGRTTGPS
jgi:hypothetical protein